MLEAVLSCLREAAPMWDDRGEGAESMTSELASQLVPESKGRRLVMGPFLIKIPRIGWR